MLFAAKYLLKGYVGFDVNKLHEDPRWEKRYQRHKFMVKVNERYKVKQTKYLQLLPEVSLLTLWAFVT
jgi:hypothetical protein